MKVSLNVLERLVLMNLIPKEGSFATLKLVRKARESLSFDDLENKKLDFKQDGDQVRWNENEIIAKEVEFGDTVENLIVEELKKLNESGKLTNEHFTLYEKFIEQPREAESDLVELEGERAEA